MPLTLFCRCESETQSGTDDYTISGGDTTWTPVSGAVISSDVSFVGTNSFDFPTSGDYYQLDAANIWNNGAGYTNKIGFAFYIDTWVSGGGLFQCVDSAIGNNHLNVFMSGTSGSGNITAELRVAGVSADSVVLTGGLIALTTWYFLIIDVDRTNTTITLTLYNASGTQIDTQSNTGVGSGSFPTTIDTIRVGEYVGNNVDTHRSNIFMATNLDEPFLENFNITSYTQYGAVAAAFMPQPNPLQGLIQR